MPRPSDEILSKLLFDAAGWCLSASDDPMLKATARKAALACERRCTAASDALAATPGDDGAEFSPNLSTAERAYLIELTTIESENGTESLSDWEQQALWGLTEKHTEGSAPPRATPDDFDARVERAARAMYARRGHGEYDAGSVAESEYRADAAAALRAADGSE